MLRKTKGFIFLALGVLLFTLLPLQSEKALAATNYFIKPSEGYYSSGFGMRDGGMHYGVDIANGGVSVPIKAGRDGEVVRSYYSDSYGHVVFIKHTINGKVWETVYAHMQNREVVEGQKVTTGQRLGMMGNTGRSFGMHLHFEVHEGPWLYSKANARNPLNYIGSTITSPDPAPSITIDDIKPSISLNTKLGVVRNFERTVIRKGPGASYPINTSIGSSGYVNPKEQYVVSSYNKGWYQISTEGWVYSEHFMYRPTNTINMSMVANQGTIATPNQVLIEGIKVKPDISLNKNLGVIRGIEASVIRTGPAATYPINTASGTDGYVNTEDQYVVYEYKNGWYRIGTNAWAYSEHNNFRPALDTKIEY